MLSVFARTAAFVAVALPFACGSPSTPETPPTETLARDTVPTIDQSTPESLLASMSSIIATHSLDSMKRMCKEGVTLGSPTWMMCGIATENMIDIDKFSAWFINPRLDSAMYMVGDTAVFPMTFAPDDPKMTRHGFLKLAHYQDRWYLYDLIWKR